MGKMEARPAGTTTTTTTTIEDLARDAKATAKSLAWYKWAFRRGENSMEGRLAFTALAASQGNLEALKWLRRMGCPFDERAAENALASGHGETLAYLQTKGCYCSPPSSSHASSRMLKT